jgi:hypothetical protein
MMTKPAWMHGLTPEQIDFYLSLEPEQAACRGRRRHDFRLADLLPGRDLPRTVDLDRVGGVYELTDHCARKCGRFIRVLTNRAGMIDWSTARYGGGGPNYLATGLGLTAGNDRLFFDHMQASLIVEAYKRRAAQAQRAAAQQAAQEGAAVADPPAARFRPAGAAEKVTA